jgi:uncharacterized membrane protein YkvA (DUF1232 family)
MKQSKSTNEPNVKESQSYYSDESFWNKLKKFSSKIGIEALEKVLTLYYCFQDPETPRKEKTIILGALGYFIMPFDAIPDLLPGGWTDDLGILAFAIAKVTRSINQQHIEKAKEALNKLSMKS